MIQTTPHNFRDIFSWEKDGQQVEGVVIPIIQRDYAQGRTSEDVNRIRERFLTSLYKALVDDEKQTLDFVYGNIECVKLHDKKMNVLTPLDGQQRLTTLFLLHYYIAKNEAVPAEEYAFLKNFSYETRAGSRDFCEKLVDFNPDFSKPSISEQITDEAWFLLEWESDPTVQSMLVMLDSIHEKFRNTSDLWPKITDDAITFYFLPINEMGLTDELYIKMNSRGKPLTQFEHWKAEFELALKEVDESLSKRISQKIDMDWTDLLWPYRDSQTGDEQADAVIDDEFLHYVHFVADIICFKNGEGEIEKDFEIIDALFSAKCENARENAEYLKRLFDVWAEVQPRDERGRRLRLTDFFNRFLSIGHAENRVPAGKEPDIFADCCRNSGLRQADRRRFALPRFLLLYAFVLYLQNKDRIDENEFRRRLRSLNNLIENSEDALRNRLMAGLVRQTEDIIVNGNIVEIKEGQDHFNNIQALEEIEKRHWTDENPDHAEALYRLEDHPLLNGSIIVIGLENIVALVDRFYNLFPLDEDGNLRCDLDAIGRAMLAIGDYGQVNTFRYQLASPDMPRIWREMFGPVGDRSKDRAKTKDVLVELLSHDDNFNIDELNKICDDFLINSTSLSWRYYLVKYPTMRQSHFGKYYWHGDKNNHRYNLIVMTTEYSLSGRNYDVFLKTIYELNDGDNNAHLRLGEYSYSMYNNEERDKLFVIKEDKEVYLSMENDCYKVFDKSNNELIETIEIPQNEEGLDTSDRVNIGCDIIKRLLNYDDTGTV